MSAYYLETSALLKRYKTELGSEVVAELLDGRRAGDVFATSHFSVLEFNAVVARMLKGREIRRRQHERLIATFLRDLRDLDVRVLDVDDALIDAALGLLPQYALRAPDALHVAAAGRFAGNFAPNDLYVVSGDRDIGEACRVYPLRYIDPEAPGALAYVRSLR